MAALEEPFAAPAPRQSVPKRRREYYASLSVDESESGSEGSEDGNQREDSDGSHSSGSQWEGSEEDESQSDGSEYSSQSEGPKSSNGA